MLRLNFHFKTPEENQNNLQIEKFINYPAQKKMNLKHKVEQMNSRIAILEKSLLEYENKVNQYKNIWLKYDSVLNEQINLSRLQKSELETIKDAYQGYENFLSDIKNHLIPFIESSPEQPKPATNVSTAKRIFFRLFHQKERNQKLTEKKLHKIEQTINQKQDLLKKLYSELKMVNNCSKTSASN